MQDRIIEVFQRLDAAFAEHLEQHCALKLKLTKLQDENKALSNQLSILINEKELLLAKLQSISENEQMLQNSLVFNTDSDQKYASSDRPGVAKIADNAELTDIDQHKIDQKLKNVLSSNVSIGNKIPLNITAMKNKKYNRLVDSNTSQDIDLSINQLKQILKQNPK